MRKIPAIASAFFLFHAIGWGQIPSSGNVFLGYSYAQGAAFSGLTSNGINMNGWEASAEGKFLPWIGVVADFDWHYGGHDSVGCTGTGCIPRKFTLNASRHSVLFGPRASVSLGRYAPFAEFLLGFTHQTETGGGVSNSDTTFSTAFGGGLDYKLVKGVAWRVEADSVHSQLFHSGRNDFRISTGIVFRF